MPNDRNEIQSNPATEAEARKNLQRYLRTLSKIDPDISNVPVDGLSGKSTDDAVRIFQKKNGLNVTGKADAETWNAICDAYDDTMAMLELPCGVRLFPLSPVNYAVSPGDNGELVQIIQYMLSELSLIFPEFSDIITDGTYGDKTAKAIEIFQARTLCRQTGNVDRITWNKLVRLFETLPLYTDP